MLPVLINDVPVDCINHAAVVYHVPATVILSVIKQEAGHNGQAVKNKNGTFDYGVMQVNTIWLSKLAKYGYSKEDLQFNACKNVEAGTWILAQALAEGRTTWQGVGNYNSHTPDLNKKYHTSVFRHYSKIESAINT
jgi:soluble lytic murein transglycosylase-like protein